MKINQISAQNQVLNTNMPMKINKDAEPAFKGRSVNGNYYEDDVIDTAKKCIREKLKAEEGAITKKKGFVDAMDDSITGLDTIIAPITKGIDEMISAVRGKKASSFKDHLDWWRAVVDASTGMLNELIRVPEATVRYYINKGNYTEFLESVKSCIKDLTVEMSNKKIKESKELINNEIAYGPLMSQSIFPHDFSQKRL